MCIFFATSDINIILAYTKDSRREEKIGYHQLNCLSQPPPITIWLQTSFTHPCYDMNTRKVSTARSYLPPTPHNIKWRYHRVAPKLFLHPPKNSQQKNSTFLITSSTHNSCLLYRMKYTSDLHSGNFSWVYKGKEFSYDNMRSKSLEL